MRRGIKIFVVLLVALSFSCVGIYRRMNIPTNLLLQVRLSLYRFESANCGFISNYSLSLTAERILSFDNVSLIRDHKGSSTGQPWVIRIVVNETAQHEDWDYPIRPEQVTTGQYEGVFTHVFDTNGRFRLWVVLYGHHDGTRVIEDVKSVVVTF